MRSATGAIAVIAWLAAGALPAAAADRRSPPAPAPGGGLAEALLAPARYAAALYCATAADTPTRADVARLAARQFPRFHVTGGKTPPRQASLVVHAATAAEAPPPSEESQRYLAIGLTEAESHALASAQGVVALELFDDTGAPVRAVIEMNALLAALAAPHGCFIMDVSARLAFSGRTWKARRLDVKADAARPALATQINKHIYLNGPLYRVVTLGMEKLGLPDIAVDQFVSGEGDRMDQLCSWIADSLTPGRLDTSGWLTLTSTSRNAGRAGEARVRLAIDAAQEGDADNRLLTVDFSTAPGTSLQERQRALLASLFGAKDDSVHGAKASDAELMAASARARKRLPELGVRFNKQLPFPQKLHIKKAFVTPNGDTEYMWIEVTAWRDGIISGVLVNDSIDPKGPRGGAPINFKPADVYDYAILGETGIVEGAETERILEAREKK
jgi:uncharacterized protein YegJ (DUF2314 family)